MRFSGPSRPKPTTPFARGDGPWISAAAWASAVLLNGVGRYEDALAAAEEGSEYPGQLGLANWSMVELVEVAGRSGAPERAADALEWLAEMAAACRTGRSRPLGL
jgi:hypothetical protein